VSQQINLFNPLFLKQRKHFSARTMLQALVLLLAGTLALYGYARYSSRALEQLVAGASRQLATQREQLTRFLKEYSPQGQSTLLEQEIASAETRLKQRRELLATLRSGGLGNTEGFSRYLVAFARQSIEGIWLTDISVGNDENDLTLKGGVLQPDLVPAYVKALNREDVMRGRQVTDLKLVARDAARAGKAPSAKGEAPKGAAFPLRYVEFSMTAPRLAAAVSAKGGK
jgi:hypothetical protein